MIDRVLVLCLAGSALFGALLVLEWGSGQPGSESPVEIASPRLAEMTPQRIQNPRVEELVATTLSRPLFSATRRPRDRGTADRPMELGLSQLRLSGIVIEPQRRIAIFAKTGAKPLARSEGETLDEWRLDSITPREVTLTGPTSSTTLEVKTDPNIARPARPQPQPPAPGRPGPAAGRPGVPVIPGQAAVPPRPAPNPLPAHPPVPTVPRPQR